MYISGVRKILASGRRGGREAQLYGRTASIANRHADAQQILRGLLGGGAKNVQNAQCRKDKHAE
ncbi:hypothetical protein GCM10009094_16870 [Massilia aurea]